MPTDADFPAASAMGGGAPAPQGNSFASPDLCVFVLLIALGLLQFFLYQRSPDFPHEDVSYVELAKSLLRDGFYGFNSVPEKVQPPGLAAILALVCATLACRHDLLVRIMPVFSTLGFLVSYEVIRRQHGRAIAASSCLLLDSSPILFATVTSSLWPSFPYLLTSMLTLFLVPKLDAARTRFLKLLLGSVLCLLLIASVMIQSAGIALIGGLLVWLLFSFFRESAVARSRLKIFLPVILLGLVAEALWLQRGSNPRDWPLPGYPGGYLSQLGLKSGNYPELGMATAGDVVSRVGKNLDERAAALGEMLTRHWISPYWASLGISGVILLVSAGVWSSLLRKGNEFVVGYFIGYEFIYLLWPWSLEWRFLLPVVPLAAAYLVEGIQVLPGWLRQDPRKAGAAFLPLCVILAVFSGTQGWRAGARFGWQEKFSAIIWMLSTLVCARLIWRGSPVWLERLSGFLGKRFSMRGKSFTLTHAAGAVLVASLIAVGIAEDLSLGRENLVFGSTRFEKIPDIRAARWIHAHTDPSAIVTARHVPLVYYYAQRRVIWFPPITRPQVLMQGIREHHIQYVIVIDRDYNYYLPPDEECFDLVYKAYPAAFRLVEQEGQGRIYEVLPNSPGKVPGRSLPG